MVCHQSVTSSSQVRRLASCVLASFLAFVLGTLPANADTADFYSIKTVEVTGEGTYTKFEAALVGQSRALQDAQQKALDKLGVPQLVVTSELDLQAESNGLGAGLLMASSLLSRKVLIRHRKILDESPAIQNVDRKTFTYLVKVRYEVGIPKSQTLGLDLSAGLNRQIYQTGEEILINLRTDSDAYVYVFNIDASYNTTLLFPNGFDNANRIKAGREIIIPSPEHKEAGFKLVTWLPDDMPSTLEQIMVLASTEPIPVFGQVPASQQFYQKAAGEGKEQLEALFSTLLKRDPATFGFTYLGYEIRRAP